jgi:4-amino-4-deoxy-L-arabinose transferase-like glycosyltransferase
MTLESARPLRRIRPDTYLFFFISFALLVFLAHLPFLDLPFYWDELGYFIPAALDLLQHGSWVPHSTRVYPHPPGLMAYLAGVWRLFGYSIPVTRCAMLLLASASVFLVFLLAIQLCRGTRGAPAFAAALLVLVSPLFYTQALLAQMDLPAMLLTIWALLAFLQGRFLVSALLATVLVLFKETGLVVAPVFAFWLWRGGRRREAWYFVLPLVALSAWLLALALSTGQLFGHSQFAQYNFFYPLHPVRVAAALLRRFHYLFLADFHWLGWIAVLLAWRRHRIYTHQAWRVAASLALVQVLAVSLLGGATLERYLLPVIPLLYIAMAAAFSSLASTVGRLMQCALMAGLLVCLFLNPPYPFPYENNLAVADFVRLHKSAAQFLEKRYTHSTITTAWPFSAALRRPEYGYVTRPLAVRQIADFGPSHLAALDPSTLQVFVLYSREWNPSLNLWRFPLFQTLRRRFYGWEPPVSPQDLETRFDLTPVARWTRRGQWITVFERRPGATHSSQVARLSSWTFTKSPSSSSTSPPSCVR